MNSTNLFPILTQTSAADRDVLLTIQQLLWQLPSYTFLEIGSYLGGSLTPFLADDRCNKILSIDHRQQQQPDERGAKYDYSDITHDTMLQNLQNHGYNTDKIEVFDGSIDQYTNYNSKYDFVFIDGEHTDVACFRDFIYAEKFIKQDCIVAFHDTGIIYKAIQIINELLISKQVKFKMITVKHSNMTCLFLNDFANQNLESVFEVETDLKSFYARCEKQLLHEIFEKRVKINTEGNDQLAFIIEDCPVLKVQ